MSTSGTAVPQEQESNNDTLESDNAKLFLQLTDLEPPGNLGFEMFQASTTAEKYSCRKVPPPESNNATSVLDINEKMKRKLFNYLQLKERPYSCLHDLPTPASSPWVISISPYRSPPDSPSPSRSPSRSRSPSPSHFQPHSRSPIDPS
jgi:hypothetical protein